MLKHRLVLMGALPVVGVILALRMLGFAAGSVPEISAEVSAEQAVDHPLQSTLTGTVNAADGTVLEGVAVSARAVGGTITTSVFTDEDGEYYFPLLEGGDYHVWAQAVGFAAARSELLLDSDGLARQVFNLDRIPDFTPQLRGSEWLASLPDRTHDDRRMKELLRVNCTECHSLSVALHQPFDEQGWVAILNLMERSRYFGWAAPDGQALGRPSYESGSVIRRDITIHRHKEELAKYLARVRGPDSPPLDFKLQPRPTGDAARVVVTEYDLPVDATGELDWSNGSDWAEGPAGGLHLAYSQAHDVVADRDGNAWFTKALSAQSVNRTIGKLNSKTGQVTDFMVPLPSGLPRGAHGIMLDRDGFVWFDAHGVWGRVDPTRESIEIIVPPPGLSIGVDNTTKQDGKGKFWADTRYGAIRFDPQATGAKRWMLFGNVTLADGFSYGVAGDRDGNGWWSQFNADRVVKADPETGKTYEIRMPRDQDRAALMTASDNAFYESVGALEWGGINSVPGAQAPRRLAADPGGDTVWVPLYLGMKLASINTRTLELQYYPLPILGTPYYLVVDDEHNVWANLLSDDRIVKFEPKTENWTVYDLPSHGCSTRNIAFDNIRREAWLPCSRSSRLARFQFRTAEQLQALKRAVVSVAARQ